MKKVLYLLAALLIIIALYVTFFAPPFVLYSPLSSPQSTTYDPPRDHYVILGFAPYWNLKKLSPESLETITHFAYFNLHLDQSGNVYKKINSKEEDPAFTNYKRLLNNTTAYHTKPLIITFLPESQKALFATISTPSLRQNTINTILAVLQETNAVGVNIDYEPLDDVTKTHRDNFTLFIKDLHTQLSSTPPHQISISTYASAASRPRLWDLKALAPFTSYFVIMTYDYTLPASNTSGPNSPLRGSGNLMEHDIVKNIKEISLLVPSRKILLGIPFYGYQWDTVDESKYSPVESKGSLASLARIDQMLKDNTLKLLWDRNTLTAYGIASDSGQISQIYFENETSLKLKIDFVKSASLGGIAIWALGYEGNGSWVWPVISSLSQ